MKKLLLVTFLSASVGMLTYAGQTSERTISSEILSPVEQLRQYTVGESKLTPVCEDLGLRPCRIPEYNWEGTDTLTYFVAAQSFTKDWQFDVNGGDMVIYDMGVVHDGNRVVITSLFNSYDPNGWAASHDYPIEGVYDEEAGTISFDVHTVVTRLYNTYDCYLCAGEFDAAGNITEVDKLVFEVTPDFSVIKSTTPFGCKYDWGWPQRFKEMTAVLKDDSTPTTLVGIGDEVIFDRTYVDMPVEKVVTVLNMGGQSSNCTVTLVSGEEQFGVFTEQVLVPAYGSADISVQFTPAEAGEFEGLLEVKTEDAGQGVSYKLKGSAEAIPDYSAIVKKGEFRFNTTMDFPFYITEVDHPIYENGVATGETERITVARSSADGVYGRSEIKAFFDVPEGCIGKLSFKGHLENPTNASYLVNSFILVDDDEYFKVMYNLTADFDDEYTHYDLAPGEHYLYIVHYDGQSRNTEVASYIWDLNLDFEVPQERGVEVMTTQQFLGYGIVPEDGMNYKEGFITIRNTGSEPMTITNITVDNEEYGFEIPDVEAKLLDEINIPISLTAFSAGEKNATFNIETTSGSTTAWVSALMVDAPDYSSICIDGLDYMTFIVNENYPFVVENGKAYNVTAQHADTEETYSSFTIYIEIPEDGEGTFFFNGHCWGTPEEKYYETSLYDYGGMVIQRANGYNLWTGFYENDIDVSDDYLAEKDFGEYMILPAGLNIIEFFYFQGGDNQYYGEDRLEIESFSLIVDVNGIKTVSADTESIVEIYDLQGRRLNDYQNGLNIIRTIMSDGTVKTYKVMMKK